MMVYLKATYRPVALLAEGVDRNSKWFESYTGTLTSPSSRRAWIEIPQRGYLEKPEKVALLAEGVDRNMLSKIRPTTLKKSPSSRRAWIEIRMTSDTSATSWGRPPRGGRG